MQRYGFIWGPEASKLLEKSDLRLLTQEQLQAPSIFPRLCSLLAAQCCHGKQRLIFSGGILTPFFPPQNIYHASLLPDIEREKTIQDERM